jgi:hypothetical protein
MMFLSFTHQIIEIVIGCGMVYFFVPISYCQINQRQIYLFNFLKYDGMIKSLVKANFI